jgi:ferrous-iron efflux pump FieF
MWIEPAMSVAAAHEVVEAIETVLEAEFPGCEVLIHLDPEGQVDHPGNLLTETDETKESIPE